MAPAHRGRVKAVEAVAALSDLRPPFATCEAVIGESCYMIQSIPEAIDRIFATIADGTFQIPFQLSGCAAEVESILDKYRDTPASLADACLIAMANQLGLRLLIGRLDAARRAVGTQWSSEIAGIVAAERGCDRAGRRPCPGPTRPITTSRTPLCLPG